MLAWDREAVTPFLERAESVPPWLLPRLVIHESCSYLTRTLPALPVDPDDSEDVDTDSDDHGYDALTGGLMARTPVVQRSKASMRPKHPDDHPGLRERYRPRAQYADEEVDVRWSRRPTS